jgi:hypothetical protein
MRRWNVLMIASYAGNEEMVKILIERGCAIDAIESVSGVMSVTNHTI